MDAPSAARCSRGDVATRSSAPAAPDVAAFTAATFLLLQRLPRGPRPTSSGARDQAHCARRPRCHQPGRERTFKQTRRPPRKPRGRLAFESKWTSVVSPPANQPREAQGQLSRPGSTGVHSTEDDGGGGKHVDTCPLLQTQNRHEYARQRANSPVRTRARRDRTHSRLFTSPLSHRVHGMSGLHPLAAFSPSACQTQSRCRSARAGDGPRRDSE